MSDAGRRGDVAEESAARHIPVFAVVPLMALLMPIVQIENDRAEGKDVCLYVTVFGGKETALPRFSAVNPIGDAPPSAT
jgi:hypothetical protein